MQRPNALDARLRIVGILVLQETLILSGLSVEEVHQQPSDRVLGRGDEHVLPGIDRVRDNCVGPVRVTTGGEL